MANPRTGNIERQDSESEHIGPDYTGDNISAKKVANYVWGGTDWQRMVQPGEAVAYESYNDTTTDTNLVYLGKATPGTASSDAAWQIKRYNKSAGHMSFADDETTFTKTWDDRTSYTY